MAKTQVSDPSVDDADAPGAAGPGDTPGAGDPPFGWPSWLRRSIIGGALVLCAVLMVVGYNAADHGENVKDRDPTILTQFPPPGGQAVRQTTVGVDLKPGYDGRLTINGIAIPEQDMDGARDPREVSDADMKANGLRPNNHNRVYFTPGPGKVIEKFNEGTLRIAVRYFRDGQPNSGGRTVSWTVKTV